jgi:hypothetical protein
MSDPTFVEIAGRQYIQFGDKQLLELTADTVGGLETLADQRAAFLREEKAKQENQGGGSFGSSTFPSSLNSEKGRRPVVQFVCKGGKTHKEGSIILPAPSSFATADNAQYGDTELGFGGKLAMNLTKTGQTSGLKAAGGALMDSIGKGGGVLKDILSADNLGQGLNSDAALLAGAAAQDSEGTVKGAAMAIGAVFNKNVTTEFTSVSTRGFTFTYELVPSSQVEGQIIHNMIVAFREGIYPSTAVEGTILRYPPKWEVNFLERADGSKNRLKSFPALAECYLESFTTTYNGNNSFHYDGRPVKTDITLSFKEDRTLTLDDIRELEAD